MIHIRIGTLSSAYFILISFLAFRTSLPQGPTLFLYNLVIITSLQSLGFYRGWFFLASSIVLTVILSLSTNFSYIWNVPVFIATFLIVKSQLDRRDYYTHIIDRRIEELGENINILTDEYNRHKKEELSLEKREARYKSLGDVATTLSTTLSIDEVEKHILNHALRIVGKAEAILLFLVDTDRQELKLVASKISRDFDHVKAKKGDLLDEWVFRERQCLLVDDIKKDFRFSEDKMKGYPRSFRSLASAPLVEAKKVLGILRLEHSRPYNYTSEDLRFLDVLCDLGAA
ncbi:MAG: GAF domain-containing protein, partial [Candidatus Omnitrophota bacterium]|nr:GAF domain-containing protein [Candidatus Omnitrophota bacterium]